MDYNRFDTDTLQDMSNIAYWNVMEARDSLFRVNALDDTYDEIFDIPDSFTNRELKEFQTKYNEIQAILSKRRRS